MFVISVTPPTGLQSTIAPNKLPPDLSRRLENLRIEPRPPPEKRVDRFPRFFSFAGISRAGREGTRQSINVGIAFGRMEMGTLG